MASYRACENALEWLRRRPATCLRDQEKAAFSLVEQRSRVVK